MLPDKIWDFWACRYESLLVQKYVLTPVRRFALGHIQNYLENKGYSPKIELLDMGCGTGQLINEAASRFLKFNLHITGVDYSFKMIELAKKKEKRARFICRDARFFSPAAQQQFDIIACLNSFPYYKNHGEALSNMYNMLKLGGIIIMVQASVNNQYDMLAMASVKLTVSRAKYFSIKDMNQLSEQCLGILPETTNIRVKPFLPTICSFIWRKS